MSERLAQVADALAHADAFEPRPAAAAVRAEILRQFSSVESGSSYLLLAALKDGIPTEDSIVRLDRRRRVDSDARSVVALADEAARRFRSHRLTAMRIVTGVTVDVTDTVKSSFTTGIQRVVRETVSRWSRDHDIVTVRWDRRLRRLLPASLERVDHGDVGDLIVPFAGTWVLPEIAVEEHRAMRIGAIAAYARVKSLAIGHDCIPLTSAEVAGPGMPGAFSRYLTALSRFSIVATTSSASEVEYRGWKRMLAGAGVDGPDIARVGLAFSPGASSAESAQAARAFLQVPDGDLVLAVGSHEPRKNHLTLLAAAEHLWQDGLEFSLVMVGGNSWDAAEFEEEVGQLRHRGRNIILASNAEDDIVWGLFRAAKLSVFPSLNEGFGLPIVESLASGTPVVTSNFGAMRELGEGNGALLVNPRSEAEVAAGVRRLLEDDAFYQQMIVETSRLSKRSWDDYADELWQLTSA